MSEIIQVGQNSDYNTFMFVGEVDFQDELPRHHQTEKVEFKTLPIIVKEGSNSVFAEMAGRRFFGDRRRYSFTAKRMVEVSDEDWENRHDPLFLQDTGGDKIAIDLEENEEERRRVQSEINSAYMISDINERMQTIAEINRNRKDYHEFIDTVEAVDFLYDNKEKLIGKKVYMTGNVEISEYKGVIYRNYSVKRVSFANEVQAPVLRTNEIVYFDKYSRDMSKFKDTGFVNINGWVCDYDSNTKSPMYFPQEYVIDGRLLLEAQKAQESGENVELLERDVNGFKFLSNLFHLEDANNNIYAIAVDTKIVRGASPQTVELTEFEKQQVEAGLKSMDDFMAYGDFTSYNAIENINTFRRNKNTNNQTFSNGLKKVSDNSTFRNHVIKFNTGIEEKPEPTFDNPSDSFGVKDESATVDDIKKENKPSLEDLLGDDLFK